MLEELDNFKDQDRDWREFPWWLIGILLIAIFAIYIFLTRPNYQAAFEFIMIGLGITISTSLYAYLIALVLGMLAGTRRT